MGQVCKSGEIFLKSTPDILQSRVLSIEIVTDTFVPDINGVAMTLGRIAQGLRERGHHVHIVRSGKAASEHESTIVSWPLPGYWEIKVGAPWPGQFRMRWKKNRPDAVYVAIETPMGFSAAAAAIKLGIPILGGYHTNFSQYLSGYGCKWVGEAVFCYQRWFHNRLGGTLVPSPDTKEYLQDLGFRHVHVLGRGVDTRMFHPEKRSQDVRTAWGGNAETPVVLIVGRVAAEKNITLGLRAWREMRRHCPGLVCCVVGNGPVRPSLMREFPDAHFTGYLTGESLAAAYASADIMLLPSETETFGNVLLEGMASGLACTCFDYAAAAWHGRHGENMLKPMKGNAQAFIEASIQLLDASLRRKLATNARMTAESLDWEHPVMTMEQRLIDAMHRCHQKNSHPR